MIGELCITLAIVLTFVISDVFKQKTRRKRTEPDYHRTYRQNKFFISSNIVQRFIGQQKTLFNQLNKLRIVQSKTLSRLNESQAIRNRDVDRRIITRSDVDNVNSTGNGFRARDRLNNNKETLVPGEELINLSHHHSIPNRYGFTTVNTPIRCFKETITTTTNSSQIRPATEPSTPSTNTASTQTKANDQQKANPKQTTHQKNFKVNTKKN